MIYDFLRAVGRCALRALAHKIRAKLGKNIIYKEVLLPKVGFPQQIKYCDTIPQERFFFVFFSRYPFCIEIIRIFVPNEILNQKDID